MAIHCCIDVSRGTAYGLSVSQLFIAIACIMFSPKKEVSIYIIESPQNITGEVKIHSTDIHVQMYFACVSALALFYAFQTVNHGPDESTNMIDYNFDFIQENVMWNAMFWFYVCASHLLVFTIILHVAELYLLLLSTLITTYCLYHACLPRDNNISITRENLFIAGYILGVVLVFNSSQRSELLLWVVVLDYFMGIGHTWDKNATVDTVTNCRLFYTCCQSLLLCVYYVIFNNT